MPRILRTAAPQAATHYRGPLPPVGYVIATPAAQPPRTAAEPPTPAAEEPTPAAEEPTSAAEPPTPAAEEPRTTPGPGLRLDHAQRRAWAEGREIPLTFREFELLAFLSAHPATVFSRADLIEQVWYGDATPDSRTVDVHVSRVRHKLGPRFGQCPVTEYRAGYQSPPTS